MASERHVTLTHVILSFRPLKRQKIGVEPPPPSSPWAATNGGELFPGVLPLKSLPFLFMRDFLFLRFTQV